MPTPITHLCFAFCRNSCKIWHVIFELAELQRWSIASAAAAAAIKNSLTGQFPGQPVKAEYENVNLCSRVILVLELGLRKCAVDVALCCFSPEIPTAVDDTCRIIELCRRRRNCVPHLSWVSVAQRLSFCVRRMAALGPLPRRPPPPPI